MKKTFSLLVVSAVVALPTALFGQPTVLPETDATGAVIVQTITGVGQIYSDNEVSTDPFGVGFDTSDGVKFAATGWQPVSGLSSQWVPQTDGVTWVLRAVNENEPASEPVGQWFNPNAEVTSATYVMLDGTGAISDTITVGAGPQGATLTFASDGTATPDAGSTAAMLSGAVLALGALRRKMSAR